MYTQKPSIRQLLCSVFSLVILSAAFSCVTPGMKAGAVKNSMPVAGRELLEEVHSIAIPAFYGDRQNWKEVSYEVLFSSKRIKVLPPDQVDKVIKAQAPDFASLRSQDRAGALARACKGLPADAVLNGMILQKDEAAELVLQLISLVDGRVLFWQAVDLSPKDGQMEHEAKKAALAEMLAPVLEQAGRRKKQQPAPAAVQPKEEPRPVVVEPQPIIPSKNDPPKNEKKSRKPKTGRPTDTVSPM